MAKFHGNIGIVETKETSPGVWTYKTEEIPVYGDILKKSRRLDSNSGETTNDDFVLNNSFSICLNEQIATKIGYIRYIWYMGVRWKVTQVEIQRPRILLTIGGVYYGENGPSRET